MLRSTDLRVYLTVDHWLERLELSG